MKFILISYDMTGGSIAYKMQQEGHDVLIGQIQNKEDTLLDEELKGYKPEKREDREMRLSQFNGLLKKVTAQKAIKFLQEQKSKKDWYIFTDSNNSWKFTEPLASLGFQGHFPTKYDRSLEVSREKAKEFVKQHYPDIKVADYKSFKKIPEGISFLKKTEIIYVLKSQGDAGDTIVPSSDNLEIVQEQLINQLKTHRKDYEQNGFILEEKIESPLELTPSIVFYDGEYVYSTVDIENKPLGAGNIGMSTGCAQNLIIKTKKDSPINKLAFPPMVYELAKQRRGYFIWDISILFDKKGTPYFGEFCSNRLGWDAFPTETAMSGNVNGSKIVTPYFQKVLKKENPLVAEYGVAIRTFNVSEKKTISDLKIGIEKGAEPDVYLYDVKKSKELVTVGGHWDLSVITGVGDSFEKAVEKCYNYVAMFHVLDMYYRVKEDFISTEYRTSIPNRLAFAKEHTLI